MKVEQTKELTIKQMSKIDNGREYRSMTLAVNNLDDQEEKHVVEGYATTFNEPYVLYESGSYKVSEQIDAKAFDECDMSDVIFQYDHVGRVFARTKNNTLSLTVDSKGLDVVADLGGTEIGRNLYQEIKGGYTDKMSFGFLVGADKLELISDLENGKEEYLRTITKITKLYDVSAVSIPANDMTSISARRYSDGVIESIKAERLERAKRIKKLKLLMEV